MENSSTGGKGVKPCADLYIDPFLLILAMPTLGLLALAIGIVYNGIFSSFA
jgi:hypothetical protein